MWQMQPDFERMEKQIEDCERIARELELIQLKYGLPGEAEPLCSKEQGTK